MYPMNSSVHYCNLVIYIPAALYNIVYRISQKKGLLSLYFVLFMNRSGDLKSNLLFFVWYYAQDLSVLLVRRLSDSIVVFLNWTLLKFYALFCVLFVIEFTTELIIKEICILCYLWIMIFCCFVLLHLVVCLCDQLVFVSYQQIVDIFSM